MSEINEGGFPKLEISKNDDQNDNEDEENE